MAKRIVDEAQKKKEALAESMYLLWALQKKSIREIAALFGLKKDKVHYHIKAYRKKAAKYLLEEEKQDFVAFYRAEQQKLMEMREKAEKKGKLWSYLHATRVILDIESKIAEITGVINANAITNVTNVYHITNIVKDVVSGREKEVYPVNSPAARGVL